MRCTIALSGRNTGDGHKGDRQGRLELRVQDIFRRFRARVRYPFSFRRAREDFEGKGQGDLEVQTAFPFPPPPSFLSFVDISRKLLGRKAKPDKIKKGKTHEIGGEESRKMTNSEGEGRANISIRLEFGGKNVTKRLLLNIYSGAKKTISIQNSCIGTRIKKLYEL